MHKGEDNIWVAYSRWPNKATRDASWPGDNAPHEHLPTDICESIKIMQAIKEENKKIANYYEEFCLDVVEDLLLT